MASSRRTGTNENVSTFGDVGYGRDYTDLAVWESATDYNLVTATTSEVLECYADASSYNDQIILNGATANASYTRIIRPASGEEHDGTPGTGVRFFSTAAGQIFQVSDSYVKIQDIVAKLTINSSNTYFAFYIAAFSLYTETIGCIAYDCTNAGSGYASCFYSNADGTYWINCLAHNSYIGFRVDQNHNYYVYNCTSTDNDYNYYSSVSVASYARAKNCVASGGNVANWGGNWTKTTCNPDPSSPTYVDSANDDFHLDSADTVCINNGTDLSADGSFAFDDDIDFESRPNGSDWDIGFDECYLTPPTTNQPIISIMT